MSWPWSMGSVSKCKYLVWSISLERIMVHYLTLHNLIHIDIQRIQDCSCTDKTFTMHLPKTNVARITKVTWYKKSCMNYMYRYCVHEWCINGYMHVHTILYSLFFFKAIILNLIFIYSELYKLSRIYFKKVIFFNLEQAQIRTKPRP